MAKIAIDVSGGDFDMGQEAAAILANVSVQSLILWGKQPNPPPQNSDRSYPARAFGKWLVEQRGTKRVGRPSENGTDYKEAETRLKVAQAEKVERENRTAEGELIEVSVVETAWQDVLMRVRSRLLQLPTTLAPIIVKQTDTAAVAAELTSGVHDALSELSENWRDAGQDEDAE